MLSSNKKLKEKREYIESLLKQFDVTTSADFTLKLSEEKSISIADYLNEALIPHLSKICATQNNDQDALLRQLILLCFMGYLSQKAWDKIWKRIKENDQIFYITTDYSSYGPLTFAACHGNLVALKRLDKIYKQLLPTHPKRRRHMLLQLRQALLETPNHLNTQCHIDSYHFLLNRCEEYATLIDVNSKMGGFANKKFAYKVQGLDSDEGETPLLDVLVDIGAQYFYANQVWAIHQLVGYIRSKGTHDDFAQFKAKLLVLLERKDKDEAYQACWQALEPQSPSPKRTISKKEIENFLGIKTDEPFIDKLDKNGETHLHKLAIYANDVEIDSKEGKFVIDKINFILGSNGYCTLDYPADPDILNAQNKTAFDLLPPRWQDKLRVYFIIRGSLNVMQDVERTKEYLKNIYSQGSLTADLLMAACIIFSKSIENNIKNKIPNLKWVIHYLLEIGVKPTSSCIYYQGFNNTCKPFQIVIDTKPFNSDVAEIAKKLKEKTRWNDSIEENYISSELQKKESMLKREQDKALYTIQDLFSRIKTLALNPKDEIYRRSFSIDQSQDLCFSVEQQDTAPRKAESLNAEYLIAPQDIIHVCGVTELGLLAAIHGSQYKDSVEINFDEWDKETARNAELLQRSTEANFFTYDIKFSGKIKKIDGEKCPGLHGFIVIQYKDADNDIRYRFFQSSMKKYSLNEFLEEAEKNNQSNDFDQEEFNEFLKQADAFSKAEKWTQDMDKFYQRYFNATPEFAGATISKKIKFKIEKRGHSLAKSLQEWNDFYTQKSNQVKPKIICPANTYRDEALLDKLVQAPIAKGKNSTILILIHDPVSGNYHYKSVSKKYLKTLQALAYFGGKDMAVYYNQRYDSSLAGKAAVYSTLFAETRALLSGKRQLFANTRAFIAGTGSLFANTRALLNGTRPLFANVRRSFGKISDQDIKNSILGVKKGNKP